MDRVRAKRIARGKGNRLLLGGAVAAVIVVVLILLLSGGSGSSKKAANGAEVLSVNELREKVAEGGAPVYWAGERPGADLELSQSGAGRTYVRYLTGGAEVGDRRPDFLTVGTYAIAKPIAALRRQSRAPGGVLGKAPGGAVVYFSRTHPHSVYLAYPGVAVEVEVYDPNFKRALRLVDSGRIAPVG